MPAPMEVTAPLLPPPTVPPAAAAPPAAAVTPPDRWDLMKLLQGTYPGALLDDNRMGFYGWIEGSYNFSSAAHNNLPEGWDDRANTFLLQQFWVRLERTVVTSGTTEPTFGFRMDWLIGSDYRYTLPRFLWNSQLVNSNPNTQNLYGVDPVQFYVNAYFPTLAQGTEVRLGRHYCPFGEESIEAISTPFWSRSYAFNSCAPFTATGLMVNTTWTPQWATSLMLVNGNDVFPDAAEETRFMGKVQWTSDSKRDSIAFGTSIGRGKFDSGAPFAPSTVSTPDEPAGRNNINVFDVVYTHTFSLVLSYALESIYGYQYGVPANVPGGIIKEDATEGTAHWGSICNYLFYTIDPHWSAGLRLEFFDDFEGQRTGYEGLYTALTGGVQFKPTKSVIFRPEIRYDYNGYSRPFEDKHYLLTVGADLIVRW